MSDYDPGLYKAYPHNRYECDCGTRVVAVGWEVETIICDQCGSVMEWAETMHDPRDYSPDEYRIDLDQ